MTFEEIKNDSEIKEYINQANYVMNGTGYTEHGFAHVGKCADSVACILSARGSSFDEIRLGMIAAYLHDIGNGVNRVNHAQTGATMAFVLLKERGFSPKEITRIITAIGNHDEKTANAVNPIAAALIIADKADVRRSRCQNKDEGTFDVHDKVNYAATDSRLEVDGINKIISLNITLDTSICDVLDYFEIYTSRMILCKNAAQYLGFKFELMINETKVC